MRYKCKVLKFLILLIFTNNLNFVIAQNTKNKNYEKDSNSLNKTSESSFPLPPKETFQEEDNLAKIKIDLKYDYIFIDSLGNQAIPKSYERAGSFQNGIANVIINGKIIIIDKKGKEIISPKYDYVGEFTSGLCGVGYGGKFGCIDKEGKEIIPIKYDYVRNIPSTNLWEVQSEGKSGILNENNTVICPMIYSKIGDVSSELIKVVIDRKHGFIDILGNEIIVPQYDYSTSFEGGFAHINSNGENWVINKKGEKIYKEGVDEIMNFSENLFMIKKNHKFGFTNEKLEEIISFKYDYAFPFSNGLSGIKVNNKWGFIDKLGKIIIPIKYDEIEPFWGNITKVKVADKWAIIDIKGNELTNFKYQKISINNCKNCLHSYMIGNKFGFINDLGQEIVKPKYDTVEKFSNGMCGVLLNNKWGFINASGVEIIPFKFETVFNFSEGLAPVKKFSK